MKTLELEPLTEFPRLIPGWAFAQEVYSIKQLKEPITGYFPCNIKWGDIVEFPWTEKDIQLTRLVGKEMYITVIKNHAYPSYFALSQLQRRDINGEMYGSAVIDVAHYNASMEMAQHLVGKKVYVPRHTFLTIKTTDGPHYQYQLPVIDYYEG